MSDGQKNDKAVTSDPPLPDLRREREQFLKTFGIGARLTEEVLVEYETLLERVRRLEQQNADLRVTVETEAAIRDLLSKIERLESEKRELLQRFRQVEETRNVFSERFHEIESELANLANLFVASNQLHATLSPRGVMRRLKEILAQLVGAQKYAIYLADVDSNQLVPIAAEGLRGDHVVSQPATEGQIGEVFESGSAWIDEDQAANCGTVERPVAVIPMSVEDRVVGVIAVYSTLDQKAHFDTVDYELFNLLGRQAAWALVSASLFASVGRRLPGLESFIDLSV